VVSGASNEDVAVAQAAVNAASNSLNITKAQQQVLVSNAYSAMLNAGLDAVPAGGNSSTGTITVTGTYAGDQSQYIISLYMAGDGVRFNVTGLENSSGYINKGTPVLLGTRGLYINFSTTGTFNSGDSWTVAVPNTQSSTYLTYANAYSAALQTQASALSSAQSTLDQATAALNLKKSQARPADVEAANAQILTAQGQFQAANAALENTIIRAPASGTITKVDIKVGQTINAFTEAVVLQNIDQLHLEANISEANVAQIKMGQPVDVTFDAFGPDQHYSAQVANLDLASTVVAGVVNYKITASLDKAENARPGMTANMTILTDQKSGILAVPQRAIVERDNKKLVRVITNSKSKTYQEREVTVGITGDGGLVEIISGLTDGQEIVTFINAK
jgi:RND family efflux transporter MFP subunit